MEPLRGFGTSVGFAAAYAAAMLLGRALPIDGQSLSVVWPACGVSALWLLVAHRVGPRPAVDWALLAVVTFAVNDLTGSGLALAAVFTLVNVAQTLVALLLLRRWLPDLWGCGGRETFTTLGALFRGIAVAAVSSAVAAAVAGVGLEFWGTPPSALSLSLHWGRNTFGFVSVVLLVHLVAHAVRFPDHRAELRTRLRGRGPELVGLVLVSAALYAAAFTQSSLPLSFVPMTATLWAGLRFPPVVVAVHGCLCSVAALGATIAGTGPLALAESDIVRGLLAQLLMGIIVVKGLALAASRREAALLLAQVRADERESAEQAAVLSTIVDSMRQGVLVLDAEGRVLRANEVASRITTVPTFRLSGTEPYGEAVTWPQVVEILVCEPSACVFDLIVDDGGAHTVVQVRSTPLRGAETGTLVLLEDVTEDRAAREELTTFASSVAHDLRTPLTAVRGWAEQVREAHARGGADPVLVDTMLDRVVSNAHRMQELIRDLLEHATSQGAELDLRLASVSQLALEVAEATGSTEVLTVERTPLVTCDKALVGQVLTNLVQNAVKYVEPGVEPRVHLAAELSEPMVRFVVTDNGVGIPEAERERVFERFYRGTTAHPGTGLGLAMCRTIVQRHGGTIHVETGPGGVGSAFVFTLPSAVPRVVTRVPRAASAVSA